jgi:hypothetical protein
MSKRHSFIFRLSKYVRFPIIINGEAVFSVRKIKDKVQLQINKDVFEVVLAALTHPITWVRMNNRIAEEAIGLKWVELHKIIPDLNEKTPFISKNL